jgi:hypothetical protein
MKNKHYLSKRDNWQHEARITGDTGEQKFSSMLSCCLGSNYKVIDKPYLPVYDSIGKGVYPDALIVNTSNNKQIYIEKKTGNAGSGNAHERAYKFGMPGIQKKIRKLQPNTVSEVIYFVFSGRTFQLPKYQEEVGLLCEGVPHAIMDETFSNIDVVSKEIKELLA